MAQLSASATDVSLLLRLRRDPGDQTAWVDLVRRYGRRVFVWCRQWGLQEADPEDVTQNVLLILAKKLRDFEYDPSGSFRAWLKTVAHHAWSRYLERQIKAGQASGDSQVLTLLDSLAARNNLAQKLEEEFDRELLELAMLRVAQRVESNAWRAFHLLTVENRSSAEAAAILGMPIAMVYVAKSRVLKMIQVEVQSLEAGHSPASP